MSPRTITPSPGPQLGILLIDDHAMVSAGLRMLIESRSDLRVVGEARTRIEAVTHARRELPDLILLDIDLGAESGLDFLPELMTIAPDARVIVLTGLSDPDIHRRAVRLGAMGVVGKDYAADVLLKAIDRVRAGELWLDRVATGTVVREMTRAARENEVDPEVARIAKLSAREREIIAVVGEGLKNAEVGRRLFISETTVRHHLTSIFEKLGVRDRFSLVLYAYKHGLAKPKA